MLIENQIVEVRWNGSNIKHYESKGYIFTKTGDTVTVKVEDLTRYSKIKVKVKCDYCKEIIEKGYSNFIIENENNKKFGIYKDACGSCRGSKISENYGTELMSEQEKLEEEAPKTSIYSEKFLIDEFYRYKDEFGIYPRKIDIDGNQDYPSATSYYKRWGNWNGLLRHLGLVGKSGLYREDEEIIKTMYPDIENSMRDINDKLIEKLSIYEINKIAKIMEIKERDLLTKRAYDLNLPSYELFKLSLIDLNSDIGKCPTAIDYDAYTKLNKLPSRRLTEKRIGSKYSILCQEILNDSNLVLKSKEELTKELLDLSKKLSRTPNANELVHHGLSTRKAYVKEFGMNFLDILKSLGLNPRLGNDRLYLSNEEMLDAFLRLKQEIGHIPSWFDLDNCDYTSNHKTYIYQFESLKNVCKILNLEDDSVNQTMSGGFVSRNLNGEICRSTPELKISNMLIQSELAYTDNLRYSELDRNLRRKWTMDWYLVDLNIYVEYFGMYNENQLNKKTRIGEYSRKVKRKIKYCKEENIILIELYVDDLKDDCKGLIEKFNKHGINLEKKFILQK